MIAHVSLEMIRLSSPIPARYTRPPAWTNFRQIRKSLPMFRARFLPVPLLAAAALLLTGALSSRPTPEGPTAPSAPPPQPDAAAFQDLDQALEALNPARLTWVEAAVWQKVTLRDLTYQAEGRYLAGPDRCFRLELRTRLDGTGGEVRVVCDGTTVRQATR